MITEEAVRKQLETLHREGAALAEEFSAELQRVLELYGKLEPERDWPPGPRVVIRRFAEESDDEERTRKRKERKEKRERKKRQEADEARESLGTATRFEERYQSWYSRALPLMKELAPDRHVEFQAFYVVDPRYPGTDRQAYVIQDFFRHRESRDAGEATLRCFRNQLAILKSVLERLAWEQLDSADQAERGLQLALLDSARGLLDVDERAAGVLAGTILETWFRKLSAKHKLKFRKQSPPLKEYADALHSAKVLDIPVHSQATWLAEIERRARAAGEPPTKLQVRDLMDGSRWLITNVF